MKPITREWVVKAEADWSSAGLLFRARKRPDYDGACFHTQQSAEKYLKARLVEAGVHFGKTHNLIALLALALTIEPIVGVIATTPSDAKRLCYRLSLPRQHRLQKRR